MERCRLIYQSVSVEEIPSNETLHDLATVAARNNERDGITGLLILTGSHFLQVLEGPPREVNALFQRISRDERHHTIELLAFEAAPEACFDDWSMRLVDLHDLDLKERKIFMDKYRYEEEAVLIPGNLHLVIALLLDARELCTRRLESDGVR